MGLMASIFGGAGSDEAKRERAKALAAIEAVKTPALSALQIQLQRYVQEGTLTPEQAEATLLNSNAFNEIKQDPQYSGATKQALSQLQQISSEGLTDIDRAKVNDITNAVNTASKGRREAISMGARERGIGGSGLELASQLSNEQEMANEAANRGLQVSSDAQARALQALQAQGNLGVTAGAQDFSQQAQKAQAQNAIDQFNASTQNQTNLYNTQAANQAQAANLATKQGVSNANVGLTNTEEQARAAAEQTNYANLMQKAMAKAGIHQNSAAALEQQAAQEKGADMAIAGGLINAAMPAASAFGFGANPNAGTQVAGGGKAVAGGVGGSTQNVAKVGTTWSPSKSQLADMGYAEGGKVPCMNCGGYCGGGCAGKAEGGMIELPKEEMVEEHRRLIPQLEGTEREKQEKELAEIQDMRNGGKVPGQAEVPGDSPKNDTVPAMLSPGELVVPRSATSDEEEFEKFVDEHFKNKMARGGWAKKAMKALPVPPSAQLRGQVPPAAPAAQPQAPDMTGKVLKRLQRPQGGF